MRIHTYKKGETVAEIAKEYGITEENIIASNIEGAETPADGEELLILTPTRTYTLKNGDTLDRLALRFGVRKIDILAQNPWISELGLPRGRTVNLKYDDRMYGTAPTNGYLYPGFNKKKLMSALPYLTYVTVGCAVADDKKIKYTFDDSEVLKLLNRESKIPLLRIFDRLEKRAYGSKEHCKAFVDDIISVTMAHKYSGVVISSENARDDYDNFGEFLIELRRAMIGCDLILVTEVDEKTPGDICELADGNILFYPKYAESPSLAYGAGEEKCFTDYAACAESAKTFIDIPSLAAVSGGFIPLEEATVSARAQNAKITTDENTLISSFGDKKRGRCSFTSLKSLDETYRLIDELGFMGASFDISSTPITHLLMYNAHFRTATHTNVRAPEGCAKQL